MSDNRIQLIAKLHQMQGGICFIGEEPLDLTKDKLETPDPARAAAPQLANAFAFAGFEGCA
jgi:hypothetical protein